MRETFCFVIAVATMAVVFQGPTEAPNVTSVALLWFGYIVGLAGILAFLRAPRNLLGLVVVAVFLAAGLTQYNAIRASSLAYVAAATGNVSYMAHSLSIDGANSARWAKLAKAYFKMYNETGDERLLKAGNWAIGRAILPDPLHPAARMIYLEPEYISGGE